MMAGLITNGYLLSPKRIEALNDAGLDFLQISIDNVEPDEVSKKSLRLLDKKLQWLREHADLRHQHQLGARRRDQEPGGRAHDQPARARARLLDLDRHHPRRPGQPASRSGRRSARSSTTSRAEINGPWQVVKNLYSGIRGFQDNLADGKPNDWRCRAGARYLYVCEDGLVHYCSQQRGYPGRPARAPTPTGRHPPRVPHARSRARPTARSAACTASRRWTSGASRSSRPARPRSASRPRRSSRGRSHRRVYSAELRAPSSRSRSSSDAGSLPTSLNFATISRADLSSSTCSVRNHCSSTVAANAFSLKASS